MDVGIGGHPDRRVRGEWRETGPGPEGKVGRPRPQGRKPLGSRLYREGSETPLSRMGSWSGGYTGGEASGRTGGRWELPQSRQNPSA